MKNWSTPTQRDSNQIVKSLEKIAGNLGLIWVLLLAIAISSCVDACR